jgi:predicted nucleotidyltransferase
MRIRLNDIKKRNIELLKAELERIQRELIKLDVEKIILFGSVARDEIGISSDLDLIVIMETEADFLTRIKTVYTLIKPIVAVDILIYTPEEIAELKKNSPFVRSALKEGEILYEKKG